MPQFHGPILLLFALPPSIASYHNKAWIVLFQKQLRYGFATQTDFELGLLVCKKVTIVQIRLKFIPSFKDQTNFFLFVFNSTEVETATLEIFCVMIPSLVYTCCDFDLFRVVRPYVSYYKYVIL